MLNEINWPNEYLPGTTDNFCSNELIVKDLSAEEVWKYLNNTTAWPQYYKNASDIEFLDSNEGSELFENARFRFKTFGFPIEAEITEYQTPTDKNPGRISWHGWAEGNEETRLDVIHAWLIENLSENRVRILTQESQIGKPAKDLAVTKPNPMINGHQDWLDGMVDYAKRKVKI
ncbi:SRPBCC family protein [Rhizosphaericola mali]|uniref:SRPBCC domain-containing protein n=1 Tax=Rhizosphaericola mali TaxID=2545455 RepID=A0A5P2G281_9BACT|nr:SRPBCC domain-containing protein [Rhizosphaericola mali]QES88199.1 SRPBCC domain-containing protein [Rhizosphaericola mali]